MSLLEAMSCNYKDRGRHREPAPATERAESIENAAFPEAAETPNGEADAAKASALPIAPVAAGVAVLAILLAVVLLAINPFDHSEKREGEQ